MKIFFFFIDKPRKIRYNKIEPIRPSAAKAQTRTLPRFHEKGGTHVRNTALQIAWKSGRPRRRARALPCARGGGILCLGRRFLLFVPRGKREAENFLRRRGLGGRHPQAVRLTIPNGPHAVRILKASSPRFGTLSVELGSLRADLLPPPPPAAHKIVFLGDSIAAGCGAAGTCAEREQTVENSDATRAFPYLTAKALGADFSVLAHEGMAVRDSMPCGYALLEPLPPDPKADFAVVAFGENDMWHATSPEFPSYNLLKFERDYADMVCLVHAKYPNAALVCVYGMMPASATDAADAVIRDAVKKSGVAASVCRMLPDERGGNLHPCAEAHEETARRLISHLCASCENSP